MKSVMREMICALSLVGVSVLCTLALLQPSQVHLQPAPSVPRSVHLINSTLTIALLGSTYSHFGNGSQMWAWQAQLAECNQSCSLVDAGLPYDPIANKIASEADVWLVEGNHYTRDWLNQSYLYGRHKRRPGQLAAVLAMEPHQYAAYQDPKWRVSIDALIAYNTHADIREIYSCWLHRKILAAGPRPAFATKKPRVAVFVSNCLEPRNHTLHLLAREFPVDSFGKCAHNADASAAPPPFEGSSKQAVMSQYMFGFAFENLQLSEYVSEKVLDALYAGSIPVYSGAPEVGYFLPSPNAIVNYNDFESVPELARFMADIARNETLYNSFFDWDLKAYKNRVIDQHCATPFICTLCSEAHVRKRGGNA